MHVSSKDVCDCFEQLLSGQKSHEDAAEWASRLRRLDDTRELSFDSPGDDIRVIRALEYLEGVDLKDGLTNYLHDDVNIRMFFEEWRAS